MYSTPGLVFFILWNCSPLSLNPDPGVQLKAYRIVFNFRSKPKYLTKLGKFPKICVRKILRFWGAIFAKKHNYFRRLFSLKAKINLCNDLVWRETDEWRMGRPQNKRENLSKLYNVCLSPSSVPSTVFTTPRGWKGANNNFPTLKGTGSPDFINYFQV